MSTVAQTVLNCLINSSLRVKDLIKKDAIVVTLQIGESLNVTSISKSQESYYEYEGKNILTTIDKTVQRTESPILYVQVNNRESYIQFYVNAPTYQHAVRCVLEYILDQYVAKSKEFEQTKNKDTVHQIEFLNKLFKGIKKLWEANKNAN